jgi:DNA-directed RNA polymerase specialized sigma24 family protein
VRAARRGGAEEAAAVPPERLHEAVASLDADLRLCLLLKVVLSHSYKEIEEITGIPETTARSHVFRARRALLQELAQGTGGDRP